METPALRVTALGVAGAPAPGRLTTSFLCDDGVLVDTGAVAWRLSPAQRSSVHTVLLSHAHLDHTLGLPFLLADTGLDVYGHPETLDAVRGSLLDGRIWPDLSDRARWHPVVPGDRVAVGRLRCEAGPARHGVACLSWLLRPGDGAAPGIALIGDTGPDADVRDWTAARAPAHCVVEVSLPDAQAEDAHRHGHQTPRDLLAWRAALGTGPRLHATHLKPEAEAAVRAEIAALGDPDLGILEVDDVLEA